MATVLLQTIEHVFISSYKNLKLIGLKKQPAPLMGQKSANWKHKIFIFLPQEFYMSTSHKMKLTHDLHKILSRNFLNIEFFVVQQNSTYST